MVPSSYAYLTRALRGCFREGSVYVSFRFSFLCFVVNVKISKFLSSVSLEMFNVQSMLANLEEEFNHWLNFIAALPFLQTL